MSQLDRKLAIAAAIAALLAASVAAPAASAALNYTPRSSIVVGTDATKGE